MRFLAVTCIAIFSAGCMTKGIIEQRQDVASGHIGCSPGEIEIKHTGNVTWEATCKGRVYYCNVGGMTSACKEKQ